MGWQHSPRTASARRTATRSWRRQRMRALNRDGHQCMIRGPRCTVDATEVDHVVPVHLGGSDELDNLASCCAACHSGKTARESAQARSRRSKLPTQPHPGLKR
jgi:5-methylcytosine-specific restriction protein A